MSIHHSKKSLYSSVTLQEYQTRNHNLVVENAEMNNVVYLYKCTECTVTIRGKINSVVIDACKKTAIVMDSVVAAVEFINCQSVQMQVGTFIY